MDLKAPSVLALELQKMSACGAEASVSMRLSKTPLPPVTKLNLTLGRALRATSVMACTAC